MCCYPLLCLLCRPIEVILTLTLNLTLAPTLTLTLTLRPSSLFTLTLTLALTRILSPVLFRMEDVRQYQCWGCMLVKEDLLVGVMFVAWPILYSCIYSAASKIA